jgi:hypothetical protein
VQWQDKPRDKEYANLIFPRHTLAEITETEYNDLLGVTPASSIAVETASEAIDQNAFVLEKCLDEFIGSNFKEMIVAEGWKF